MEELKVEELLVFFAAYGLPLTIIAVLGVVILGILKYAGAFAKFEEKVRHYFYFGISIGFSVIASTVYLLIIKQFDVAYLFAIASAIYALDQAFYSIFEVTSLNDLCVMILEAIIKLITNISQKAQAKRAARKARRAASKKEK